MSPRKRLTGRRPDERRLQELLDFLRLSPGGGEREIARAIDPAGAWWNPSRVQSRIRQLRDRGLLHETQNEVIQTELWSYLLLDVPTNRRDDVRRTLDEHAPDAERIDADGVFDLDCNLLVRTRRLLDADSIVLLCRRCVDAGARNARGLKFAAS